MWPHRKRFSLKDSDIFKDFTDWHTHILPGVDDGVQTMEKSLEILHRYEELGIKSVWLTPHIMEDMPNTTEHLRNSFAKLQATYQGTIKLYLASENMLDNLFKERLEKDDLLPFERENKRYLLVETSYFTPPINLYETLEHIKTKGYYPMLAHPERYIYMDNKEYRKLKEQIIGFQLNLPSLVGAYGIEVKNKAEWLLNNNFYNCCGSDFHCLNGWEKVIKIKMIYYKSIRILENM